MRNRKQVRARGKRHGSEHLQRQRSGNLLVKGALPRIWIVETARTFILLSILLLCLGFSLAGTPEDYRNVIPKYFTHTNVFYCSITLEKSEDTSTLHIWETECTIDCGMVITWVAIKDCAPGHFLLAHKYKGRVFWNININWACWMKLPYSTQISMFIVFLSRPEREQKAYYSQSTPRSFGFPLKPWLWANLQL